MSDLFDQPGPAAPPASPRRSSGNLAGWAIAVVVVLILAVAGGLFTAWVVANMRAVPAPVAFASPTPAPNASSCLACATASAPAASSSTPGPRFTPTPAPTVELTPAPFTYVVEPGDKLVNIAAYFQVSVQDIIDLNNLKNPNNIQVGQELLIPGYGVQPTPKPTKKPK